jgi:CRP-like cAMP-binding protein
MVKLVKKVEEDVKAALSVRADEYVYHEGDAGAELYLIEDGRVELVKGQGEGEGRLGVLEAGDFFGENSLLTGRAREASARAMTDCRLLRIDGPVLADLLRDPDIALRMLRRLSRHLATSREERLMAESPVRSETQNARIEASRAEARPRTHAGTTRLVHKSGVELPLPDKDEALVGRADPKTGFVPDIDLAALDAQRSLSRRHARICRKGAGFVVTEEPGVRNGTFVNGKAVKAGAAAPLKEGDEVSFGLIKTTFRLA